MSLSHLISESKTLLGGSAVITEASMMGAYTMSMRYRRESVCPMIALPQSTEQVAGLVRLCRKHGIAIVPQGGNTGLVDGGLPRQGKDEIIVNLSRMNKIRAVDPIGLIATVEAGVVLHNLRKTVAEQGLLFPLSIASEGSAEIGGLISTNAGGSSASRYGSMRQQVLGIEAVLPNGEIISGLKTLAKDNTGYHLASCFIGAEGTLGLITAATLRLLPALRQKVTAVVAVPDARTATDLLTVFRREAIEHLTTFEFMSLAALRLLMKNVPGAKFPSNTQEAPYYVLIELGASSPAAPLREMFESLVSAAIESGKAVDAVIAESAAQAAQFWHAREHIHEALRAEKQRVHFDIAVPVAKLADFLTAMDSKIKAVSRDVVLMPFGHIGDGNVHYNMYMANALDPDRFALLKTKLQDLVFTEVDFWHGSVSAEHGVGVERKAVLAKVKSVVEMEAMRSIKRAFDPEGLMNPGKIFD